LSFQPSPAFPSEGPGLPAEARNASEGWSGRRGSNPRPTAWKAVTLPLSYSRLRAARCPRRFDGQARLSAPSPDLARREARLRRIARPRATGEPAFNPITRPAFRRPSPDLAQSLQHALTAEPARAILVLGDPRSNPSLAGGQRACQPKLATDSASPFGLWRSAFACVSERRLVAREGLEPSKPLGRQIYSLLRLTAPQPRQLSVWNLRLRRLPWLCCCRQGRQRVRTHPTELAEGFEPPTG
jgi:hypothetical protein